jgi:hypothetical protein
MDITMCKGTDCPLKENCYRFTAIANEYMQSYFVKPPIKDGKCEDFWDNLKKVNKIMNTEYKMKQIDLMADNTASVVIEKMLDDLGKDLSDIINQDGDDLSDGECIDMIVQYLKDKGLYIPRND